METKKTSILVLEEHPMMRESLCAAIAAETDLQVMESFPNIPDTLELTISSRHDVLFLTKKPDIILLALGNPGIDELNAIASIRTKLTDTPILALTRAEVPGQERAALVHGARAVLAKSASREELLRALRTIKTNSQVILQPVG